VDRRHRAACRDADPRLFDHDPEIDLASAFQTSAPTLRRAFACHGFGHPHAGLDRAELQRRWSTKAKAEPDHRNRQQRRIYRARLAAEQRTF
jgi:hypothetical protein